MTNSLYINNTKGYQAALLSLNKIFCIEQRLPDQVFKTPFFGFTCEDFDDTMTANFWNTLLQPIGKALNDSHILTAVLDPDPKNYFYPNFGYYNMLNMPIDTTGTEYLKSLETGPVTSPADAILYNSEIVVWAPSGGRWAVWGQRDCEICILAFADEQAMAVVRSFLNKNWKSPNIALNKFVLKYAPKNFLDVFLSNYL